MSTKMSLKLRWEMVSRMGGRYREAFWSEKGRILDEFVAATGYGRKYAITLLNRHVSEKPPPQYHRRRRLYGEAVRLALIQVWNAANRICSKRLVPFLPEFLGALERFGHLNLDPEIRTLLLSISPATVDRLLFPERHPGDRTRGVTRPGSLLKKQIRVRTFADWNEVAPGFFEADLVAHCGESMRGAFLNTLVLTDIATGWTECVALLRRSETDVAGALELVRQCLPFPMLGLDTDNGSEFINHEMIAYCNRERISFTRSRPYRKNDQCHVEEKNGSVVRRLVGHDRYEGKEAWTALNELYGVLRLYVDFYQPSMKLVRKVRVGSRTMKVYATAQTPHQRLLAAKALDERRKERLNAFYSKLDPVGLLVELRQRQDHLWTFGNCRPTTEPGSQSPTVAAGAGSLPVSMLSELTRLPQDGRYYHRNSIVRHWRTRKDPFETVWPEIRLRLQIDPTQTAKSLLEDLQVRYPGSFLSGQLRTLQRRVREWHRVELYRQVETVGFTGGPPPSETIGNECSCT
jgi:hypothetical protein